MYITVKNKETGARRQFTQKSFALLDKKTRSKYEIVQGDVVSQQAVSPNAQAQVASVAPAVKPKGKPGRKKAISSPDGVEN